MTFVGNIMTLGNMAPVSSGRRDRRQTVHNYTYDDLYQLTTANGTTSRAEQEDHVHQQLRL